MTIEEDPMQKHCTIYLRNNYHMFIAYINEYWRRLNQIRRLSYMKTHFC